MQEVSPSPGPGIQWARGCTSDRKEVRTRPLWVSAAPHTQCDVTREELTGSQHCYRLETGGSQGGLLPHSLAHLAQPWEDYPLPAASLSQEAAGYRKDGDAQIRPFSQALYEN